MASTIVVFGATGYTGRLTAERLVAQGERPVLAGRSAERLGELAERLGGLEVRQADALRRNGVFDLVGDADVLVATVGPFVKYGEAAVRAAIAAGATYIDSTGEPAFVRRVFEEFGPPAARAGASLLTAMGYDFVPGALAGALALEEAGEEAIRVDVGYYALGGGPNAASGGTRTSGVGAMLNPAPAYRNGRIQSVRTAERTRSFPVRGKERDAISYGGAEHYTLPEAYPHLLEVNVYLGWFPGLSRTIQAGTLAAQAAVRLPGARAAMQAVGERVVGLVEGPEAGTTPGGVSWIVAEALDGAGRSLAEVHLSGANWYDFTAGMLAWSARRAAHAGVDGSGALGPVAAFGLETLEAGCAEAGLTRVAGD
jgi:short subunit dehydrogenase-like uncharacterized protein